MQSNGEPKATKTSRLQVRCGKCQTLFDSQIPVECPVTVFVKALRKNKCPNCGSKKDILLGQSRTASEDDSFRKNEPPDASIQERLASWRENGEIGSSAEAIAAFMTGAETKINHPHDTSDFRRCLLLLRRIPEWRPRVSEMAILSPVWAKLAPQWNAIADLFETETGPNLERMAAEETAKLLDTLISQDQQCP